MNSAIEQGLRAYLEEKLEATEQTLGEEPEQITALAFELEEDGPLTTLHCNIAGDSLPADKSWVIVGVKDASHLVGGLYTAQVAFAVGTPSKVDGFTDTHHRALVAAVRACFPDMQSLHAARAAATPEDIAATQEALEAGLADVALLAEKLQTSAAVTISATSPWFMQGSKDGVESKSNRWQTFIELKLAVHE